MKFPKRAEELPREGKAAVVQAMSSLSFTIPEISEILDIPERTVSRYKVAELSEKWQEFGERAKRVFVENDYNLAKLASDHIQARIGEAKFFELVGLYKIARELQVGKNQTTNVQVNFQQNIGQQKQKYDL